jgi:hypothetical protein
MRVANKVIVTPTLRVDDNFASLLSVEDDGSFVYEIRFFSRTIDALRAFSNTVRLSVRRDLPRPPPDVFRPARDASDVRGLLNNVLTAESQVKDAKRSARAAVITTATVDLTSRFSNSSTSLLSSNLPASSIVGTQRVIQLQTVAALKQNNVDPPVLQTNALAVQRPPAGAARAAAMGLIMRGVDPASAAAPTSTVNGTFSAISGFGPSGVPDSLRSPSTATVTTRLS